MQILQPFLPLLCIALLVIVSLEGVLIASINNRLARQSKLLRDLFAGPQGEDLQALLHRNLDESRQALDKTDELDEKLGYLSESLRGCVQHVGLVRFDAFGDVSGQQSFSMALLDGRDNGAIITALFGRTASRCYGKMIVDGHAEQQLSEEESEALTLALEGQQMGTKTKKGKK